MRLKQIWALVEASQELRFAGRGRAEVYAWIGKTLSEQYYSRQSCEDKGLLRSYVLKVFVPLSLHSSVKPCDYANGCFCCGTIRYFIGIVITFHFAIPN